MQTPIFTVGQKCFCKAAKKTFEATVIEASPQGFWVVQDVRTGKKIKISDITRLKPLPAACPRQSQEEVPFSLIDAAAKVLGSSDKPLLCTEIIDEAVKAGIWQPKAGKTPANTLYSSISREIKFKQSDSRFRRSQIKGKFELAD